jgi:hypothetical protein
MDRLIRGLAVRIAEATSRRDFTSMTIRGVLGAGAGMLTVLGGCAPSRISPSGCTHLQSHGCEGEKWCPGGDPMGCNIAGRHTLSEVNLGVFSVGVEADGVTGADIEQCITCDTHSKNPCVGSTPNIEKWWACCCGGRITVCVDCVSPGWPTGPWDRRRCICEFVAIGYC